MYAPMLVPFLGLGAGIILASITENIWLGAFFILAGSSLYLWLQRNYRNPIKNYRFAPLHFYWIALWFLGIGIIEGVISAPQCPPFETLQKAKAAEGEILDIRNSTSGDILTLDISKIYFDSLHSKKYHNFKIKCHVDAITYKEGDVILLPIIGLKSIEDSKNSFRKGYAETMAKKGIYYSCRVSNQDIRRTGHKESLMTLSGRLRNKFVDSIEHLPLQKETQEFIITVLTGDSVYLQQEERKKFSDAGISHILALSGMHIGIITAIFLFILFPINFTGRYKIRYIVTACLLWVYAFITGLSPSIVRACVMATAFIIAMAIERKNSSLNSLALAGFIILLFSPQAMYEIGFQLSFICVASLILFATPLNPIDKRFHPYAYKICASVLACLIATFSSWIVVAYYFKSFPTMFLPANIVILPLIPLYISLILILILLHVLGVKSGFMAESIDFLHEIMTTFIEKIGHDSALYLTVPGSAVVLWCVGLVLLGLAFHIKWKKTLIITASSMFVCSILFCFNNNDDSSRLLICNTYPNVELKVPFGNDERSFTPPANTISVNRYRNKTIMVIDYKNLSDSLLPSLSKHLSQDIVILTGRYKGGIDEVVSRLNPTMVVIHGTVRKKKENEWLREAEELKIKVHSLRKDDALEILTD